MSEPSLERIRPLVARLVLEGSRYEVLFRCPVTQVAWLASGSVPASADADHPCEAAILRAFLDVERHFAWDSTSGRYVALSLLLDERTPLAVLLGARPVREPHDRAVLAQMLADMTDEVPVHATFADGAVVEIGRRPAPLTRAEIAATSPTVRESMLAMVYAEAFAAGERDVFEHRRAEGFREALGIMPARARILAAMAREFVVEQALEAAFAGGRIDPAAYEQASRLALSLGVRFDELADAEARCRRRHGMG